MVVSFRPAARYFFGVEIMSSDGLGGIRRLPTALTILLTVGSAARLARAADEGRKPAQAGRVPWTTSRVVGSPDPPPPFKVVRAFPNLKFRHPVLIARYPEGNRLVVGEQSGILHSFPDRPDARSDVFLDLPREIQNGPSTCGGQGGRGGVWAGFPPGLRAQPSVLRLLYHSGVGPPPAESRRRHAGVPVPGHSVRPAADRPVDRGDHHLLPARRPQRRGSPLRPRRHALHIHGRRGESQPARPFQHGAGHLRPALVHPADRRGPEGRREELCHPQGQPLRRHGGRPARGLGVRPAQSLADELRSQDRRAVCGRRGLGAVGVGPSRRKGRQLRLVRDGGAAADQVGSSRADPDPASLDRAAAHNRV